jgi:osmotically-inducible protein OsmY
MRALFSFLFVFFLSAGVAPAAAAAGDSSDNRIYDQVRRRLANDPDVKGGAILVEVQDGVVTLRGKVKEERGKAKAERLTRKVKGVKKVVNELETEIQEAPRPGTAS